MSSIDNNSRKSYVSIIIRIAIAAAACWLVFKDFNISVLGSLRISTLLLAIGLFALGLCLIGLRWWVFMRAQNIHIPLFLAIKLTFLGQFFTNFMPSAVGGDLIRAWYISRHTNKKLQAALGVVVDRIVGLLSTFVLAATSYLLFMRGKGVFQVKQRSGGTITAFFDKHPVSFYQIVLTLFILFGVGFLLSSIFNLKRPFKILYGHLLHAFGQFRVAISVYYHHPLVLVFGVLITICLQSMVIVSLWLVGRNLGMTAQLRYYFVFFPLVWVVGAMPISIGGLGILEGGIVLLFVRFTGAEEDAVKALAICQRLTLVIASIPGLLVHLSGSHRHEDQSG
ncbi:MAG: flippase-like domain-containing protein [Planctomycetes bacterium]|nr:flippase-like domain-containing protein [Planctomycetota bacterium]